MWRHRSDRDCQGSGAQALNLVAEVQLVGTASSHRRAFMRSPNVSLRSSRIKGRLTAPRMLVLSRSGTNPRPHSVNVRARNQTVEQQVIKIKSRDLLTVPNYLYISVRTFVAEPTGNVDGLNYGR